MSNILNAPRRDRSTTATSIAMARKDAWSDDRWDGYIMSSALAKFTGLYYVVDAEGGAKSGRRNAARAVVVTLIAFVAGCLALCPFGIYHWSNDPTQLILQFVIFGNFSFGCFKAYRLVRHADDVRACVELACIDFARFGGDEPGGARDADRTFLRSGRAASTWFARCFAVCNYGILFAWSALPFVVGDQRVTVRNRDGSTADYRCNPFNMYFAVSADTYNRWHHVFHVVEWLNGLCFVLSMVMFDTFMVTLCTAITGQLKVVAEAYKRLAHKPVSIRLGRSDRKLKNSKTHLNDLKSIIVQHQAVLRKMNDFYNIVRPVILPQLIVASFSVISLSYIITMNYYNGILWTSVQSFKFCAFPTFICQLYYTCLIFGSIDYQKNEMNFALYSSNWTKMEMKSKRLVLLAMKMHNSNKLNMKLTEKLVINLELFASVMNLCYSIFSVLVNSQLKLTKKL